MLYEVWYWLLDDPDTDNGEQQEYIYKNVLEPGWNLHAEGLTGCEILRRIIPRIHTDGARLWAARGVATYYAEVGAALEEGHYDLAWELAAEANYHVGVVCGMLGTPTDNPVRENARKAAAARHAENREIAERIQTWFIENHQHYRSKDAAAEAVTRIEPVAFRTARKHIGAAAKNLPPASKE